MDTGATPPDWELLRRDPQQFFELPEEFDHKELKRSYNRWIRRFKPEAHPQEFQLIRRAYEELDRWLRYGTMQFSGTFTSDLNAPIDRSDATTRENDDVPVFATDSESEFSRLHKRIRESSPLELYADLQAKPKKTAYEYYALAVLSDICDPSEHVQFARWLLAGIQEYSHDTGLLRLLQAYFQGPLPETGLPELLIDAAKAIGGDAFYPLTEAGWEHLLRNRSLDVFVTTLRECERHLRAINITGRIAFVIRILRAALWKTENASKDSMDWISEAMLFVETNFNEIPYHADFDLELLSLAHDYLGFRRDFVDGGVLHARLDRTLEIYFTENQTTSDPAIVLQQLQLARDVMAVLEAFPIQDENPSVQAFYPVWELVSHDVASRYGVVEQVQPDVALWANRAQTFLAQLESKSYKSYQGRYWEIVDLLGVFAKWVIYAVVWILIFFPLLTLMFFVPNAVGEGGMALIVTGIVIATVVATRYAGRWVLEKTLGRWFYPYSARLATRTYNNLWRRDAAELLERSRMPFHLFNDLTAQQASIRSKRAAWISNHISRDYGLAIYSLALRHVV